MQHLLKFTKLATCIAALSFLVSCDKNDEEVVSGQTYASVTNASPDGAPVDMYVDNIKVTPSPVPFGATTGTIVNPYLTFDAGTRSVRLSPDGTTNYTQGNIPFNTNAMYSIFLFDTLSATSTLKGIILFDDLSGPAVGKAHVRFVHLSPDAGTIDVDLAKTNDTTKMTNRVYSGNLASIEPSVSAFTPVNAGNYNINLRTATTTTQLATLPYVFEEGKIYTVYARGLKNGTGTLALNSSVIVHN